MTNVKQIFAKQNKQTKEHLLPPTGHAKELHGGKE